MIVYLLAMFGIGLLAKKHIKESGDFWVAGRRLGIGVLTGTFGATFISSFTMIGMAGAGYRFGWSQWMIANGTWLGPLIMILTMQYFVRFMGFTVPDIVEARYGAAARPVAAIIAGVGSFAFAGVQMYAMGTVLRLVFGWPMNTAIFVSSLAFIAYAVAGGFLAVAWTDCVQAVMLMVGIFLTALIALARVGGFNVLNTALVGINPGYVDPWGTFKSPMTVMAMALAFGLGNPSQPAYLARAYAARNTTSIRMALANGALMNVWAIFCGLAIGMSARVLFGPNITPVDAVFPYLIIQLTHPLFAALVLSAIIAAIMSTADSLLIVVGTTVARDFYQRYVRPDADEAKLVSVTRWSIAAAGLLAIGIAVWQPGSILTMGAYVFGAMGAGFFIPLYVGLFWRRATTTGGIAGMLAGVVGVVFFTRVPVGIHPIIMGAVSSLLCYVVFSYLMPEQKELVDAFMVRIGRQPPPDTLEATS
jgi:sodium/proline symporter